MVIRIILRYGYDWVGLRLRRGGGIAAWENVLPGVCLVVSILPHQRP